MSGMLEKYFLDLEAGLKKKLEQKETGRRKFIHEISRVGGRMFDSNRSSAWTTLFVPYEILNAMGVSGNFIEFVGAMLAGGGLSQPYLEKAESAGYSTDTCAYHRTVIGSAMDGFLPEPDLLIGATFPCDGGVKALKRVGEIYKKDVFVINMPYEYTVESLDYLVYQFRSLIDYIKEKTGRDMDYDLLRQSIRHNNTARAYMIEALDLCKNVPSPARSDDLKNFIIYVLLAGSEAAIEVAKVFRDEFKEKVNQGIGGLANETHRLLWIQNRIQFKNSLIQMLETEFGANVVIDELNYVHWGPMDEDGDPLRALALRLITHPIIGDVGRRLEVLQMLAREYHCHGAINPAHWGCRQSGGARHMFKEALQAVGVPVIHLDVDCVDERNFSEGQLRTRLEAFMEML